MHLIDSTLNAHFENSLKYKRISSHKDTSTLNDRRGISGKIPPGRLNQKRDLMHFTIPYILKVTG